MKRILSLALTLALVLSLAPIFPAADANTGPGGTFRGFPQEANFNYAINRVRPPVSGTNPRTQAQMNQDVIDQFAKIIGEFMVDFEPSRNDTMNNPDTFRMVLAMFGGTGPGIAGIGITTSETHGYGMMILAYMAGSEEAVISSGVTTTNQNGTRNGGTHQIGGMRIKDVLKLCLPQSLRDAYGSRDVTVRDYYDAMFRTMNHFPASGGSGHHIAWALTSGTVITADPLVTTPTSRMRPFQEPLRITSGPSTATDGSLDTAYAMLVAEKQWGTNAGLGGVVATNNRNNYGRRARLMMQEIWNNEVDNGRSGRPANPHYYLYIGNWVGTGNSTTRTRPSDFMLQHLRAFEASENILEGGVNRWTRVINTTQNGMRQIYNSRTFRTSNSGVLPDFVLVNRSTGNWTRPEDATGASIQLHETANDGNHWSNSCRVPWRLGTDALLHGHGSGSPALHREGLERLYGNLLRHTGSGVSGWGNMRAIEFNNGNTVGNHSGIIFAAPGMVAATIYGTQADVARAWAWARGNGTTSGRGYGAYINILCMITASGNWWCPATSEFAVDDNPVITVGAQVGTMTAGVANSDVTYAVTTLNVPAATYTPTLNNAPAGVTRQGNLVIAANGSGTLTLRGSASTTPGTSSNLSITMPVGGTNRTSNSFSLSRVNAGAANAAVGFAHIHTLPVNPWDNGFNSATSPKVEFDITVDADHVLTLPAWQGGNGTLETRNIFFVQPTAAANPNRKPVSIQSITVSRGGSVIQTHGPIASTAHVAADGNNWLIATTLGTANPVVISSDGSATTHAALFAAAGVELRRFDLPLGAISPLGGDIVRITYRVGTPTVPTFAFSRSAGANGSIAASSTANGNLEQGASVSLTATPNTGYRFVNWTGTGLAGLPATANPFSFTMPAGAVTLTANFELIPVDGADRRAIGFVYMYSDTNASGAASNNWDAGFNQINGPFIDFDITVPGVHTLTLPAWTRSDPRFYEGNTRIHLLEPFNLPAGALTVTAVMSIHGLPRLTNLPLTANGAFWNQDAGTYFATGGVGGITLPGGGSVAADSTALVQNGVRMRSRQYSANAGNIALLGPVEQGTVISVTYIVGNASMPTINYGDVNGDGVINSGDVTMLKYYIASSDRPAFRANNPTFNFNSARVTGGTDATAADISLIQLWIATPVPDRGAVRLGPPTG